MSFLILANFFSFFQTVSSHNLFSGEVNNPPPSNYIFYQQIADNVLCKMRSTDKPQTYRKMPNSTNKSSGGGWRQAPWAWLLTNKSCAKNLVIVEKFTRGSSFLDSRCCCLGLIMLTRICSCSLVHLTGFHGLQINKVGVKLHKEPPIWVWSVNLLKMFLIFVEFKNFLTNRFPYDHAGVLLASLTTYAMPWSWPTRSMFLFITMICNFR